MSRLKIAPTKDDAILAFETVMKQKVVHAERFSSGLVHYVYDITTASEGRFVVRMARPDKNYLSGTQYWSEILHSINIPIPSILFAD